MWLKGTTTQELPSLSSVLIKVPFCANCICSSQIDVLLIKTRSFCLSQPVPWGNVGNADAIDCVIAEIDSKPDFDQCSFELV